MYKCMDLCKDLYVAIVANRWEDAIKLVDDLRTVLLTYRDAC
jgi:hypothetical protein